MTVYDPVPRLNSNDKRLLHLLGELLIEQLDAESSLSNSAPDRVVLSDREASELLELIERLVSTREFLEKISFVERIVDGQLEDERDVKEIYLAGRRRAGRKRVASSWQWADFQVRLGISRWPIMRPPRSRTMDFKHFLEMEGRLCTALNTHPRVTALIINLIQTTETDIEVIRSSKKRISLQIVRNVVQPIIEGLKTSQRGGSDHNAIGKYNVSALWTVIADTSVFFATRDWGVAGTISTIAGALMSINNDPHRQ